MTKLQNSLLTFLSIIGLLAIFSLFPQPTLALECPTTSAVWYNQDPCTFRDKVMNGDQNEIFGERYTFAQVNWIINSLALMLDPGQADQNAINAIVCAMFQTPVPGLTCPTSQGPNTRWSAYASYGVSGLLGGSIAEMGARPVASGVQDIGNSLAKFQIAEPAMAQGGGYGFQSLDGVRILWGASRSMAYLLMVVLLIATGFMIMFRVKINPQTAVSLQIMIPKVIFTLLLVTFSYAIAGLVIDLVYVLLAFIISGLTLTRAIIPDNLVETVTWFFHPDFAQITWYYVGFWIITGITGAVVGALSVIGAIPGGIIAVISLLFLIIFGWLLFKVWWMMVKTYLTLMFLIIIGPWQIMFGLLPGQQGFGAWIRNIIANASVFLTVPVMFLLNMFFWPLNPFKPIGLATMPNFSAMPDFPLFGSKGDIFGFAIGFAILSMIPKVAEIIRDALKVPPFKYGTAFGEALGPISGAGNAAFGGVIMPRVGGAINEIFPETGGVRGTIGGVVKDMYNYGVNTKKWSGPKENI